MNKQATNQILSETRVFLAALDAIITRAESLSDEDLSDYLIDFSLLDLQSSLNFDSTKSPRILFELEYAMDQILKIKDAPKWVAE
jgi:hypothetical protein